MRKIPLIKSFCDAGMDGGVARLRVVKAELFPSRGLGRAYVAEPPPFS